MSVALEQLTDLSTFLADGTFDMTDQQIVGARVVLEWVARSWLTRVRDLFWAPTRGEDIVRLVNSDHTPADVEIIRGRLWNEARKTDFVTGAQVTITVGAVLVTIEGSITLANGKTYPLAVSVNDAGAALARFGGPRT